MDLVLLNASVGASSAGHEDLLSLSHAYASAVQQAARVVGVAVTHVRVDADTAAIILVIQEPPAVLVRWTPAAGSHWCGEGEASRYRVREADAVDIVPAAETVAAWLGVLAAGDRSGSPRTARGTRPGRCGLGAYVARLRPRCRPATRVTPAVNQPRWGSVLETGASSPTSGAVEVTFMLRCAATPASWASTEQNARA